MSEDDLQVFFHNFHTKFIIFFFYSKTQKSINQWNIDNYLAILEERLGQIIGLSDTLEGRDVNSFPADVFLLSFVQELEPDL